MTMLAPPVTPTYGIYVVAREVAGLLEPDPTLRDDAYARPVEYLPDRLYAWPVRDAFAVDDMNPTWRQDFEVRVAWAAASNEAMAGIRDPDVTAQIEATVERFIGVIRVTLSGDTFDSIRIVGDDYISLVTTRARGFLMDLTGYRRRSD